MILVAAAYIAVVIAACFALLVLLEVIAPDLARGWFGAVAEDNEAAEEAARDELHCLDEPRVLPDWDAIERFKAMHAGANAAKRRRIESGQQQMQKIWRDTTGGDAA